MLGSKSRALMRAEAGDDGNVLGTTRLDELAPQIQGQVRDGTSGAVNDGLEGPGHGCVVHGVDGK